MQENKLQENKSQKNKPQIKICGLTSEKEVEWILEEAVDYFGIVLFYPKSKRNLSIEQAKKLLAVCHASKKYQTTGRPLAVAVTVSPDKEQVRAIQEAGFDCLQIHGTLSPDVYEAITLPIIRAYQIKEQETQEQMQTMPRSVAGKIIAYLYDAHESGSGKAFDWNQLKQLPANDKQIFLAGGLHTGNVAEAIKTVHPDVVDVSSGVEIDVKKIGKDREKIKEFVRKVETDE